MEEADIGITHATVNFVYYDVTYRQLLCECAAGGFLFLFVGLYLDKVMPTAVGGRKHPCFCLKRNSYSCCKKQKKVLGDTITDDEELGCLSDDDEISSDLMPHNEKADIEIKDMAPENYEPVPAEVAR